MAARDMDTDLFERALREVDGAAASGVAVQELAETVARWAMRLHGASGASITQRVGDEMVYIVALGGAAALLGQRNRAVMSFTGVVMLSGKSRAFEPERAPPSSQGRAKAAGFRSGIVVPILDGNKPVGTLGLTSTEEKAYCDEDGRALRRLAAQLGPALGRASGD